MNIDLAGLDVSVEHDDLSLPGLDVQPVQRPSIRSFNGSV